MQLSQALRLGRPAAAALPHAMTWTSVPSGPVRHPLTGLGAAKVLTLIGYGAVVSLWQRPSSAFFRARASVSR